MPALVDANIWLPFRNQPGGKSRLPHDPMSSFIHYLPRRVVFRNSKVSESPWYGDRNGDARFFAAPTHHITRSRFGPAARVSPGDTIWIVSQLRSPGGNLPPCIDARIEVAVVTCDRGGTRRFDAGPASRWFPIYSASPELRRLKTKDADGYETLLLPSPVTPVGRCLQSLRELANPEILQTLETEIDRIPFDFVSYRIADGTASAFGLVGELLADGRRIFWDRWSLPRRLAERREEVDGNALNDYLLNVLRDSGTVWVVESPLYAELGSYSAVEYEFARSLGKEIRKCGK
jgi:hypothetical protein